METNSQMDNGRLAHTDENILRRLIFKGGGLKSSHVDVRPELLMNSG